jgi:hypothetical protein
VPYVLVNAVVYAQTPVAQVLCRPGTFESMKSSPLVVGSLDPIVGIRLATR